LRLLKLAHHGIEEVELNKFSAVFTKASVD